MTSFQDYLCPACGNKYLSNLLEIESVPVYCNVLWTDREMALSAERGRLELKYCPACGHVFNVAYDADLTNYTPAYDNSLHFSPQFNEFTADLAARLIERHGLREKTLVEIGCGKGEFLMQLCAVGNNRGWGFDRSFDPARAKKVFGEQIHFSQDYYRAVDARRLRPDFVCCRQVLEHLPEPRAFLDELRRGFADYGDAALYIEVPNSLFTLKDLGIWDLIYEHCDYYSLSSFTQVVMKSGFDVLAVGEAFAGQFIFIEMTPGTGKMRVALPEEHRPVNVSRYAGQFTEQYYDKIRYWRDLANELRRKGRSPVVWGTGSKGVSFLNILGGESGIEYAVDVNPYKHGKYVAGTGQQVVPPQFLQEVRPTDVIVMNPVYEREIAGLLGTLGVDATLWGV
jgi:hypothetical protein